MAGSFGRCVLNDVRNCQTVFQTGCTILHFHQVYKISIWSMLISSFFFILDILIGLWWYLSVVLIGISLVTQYSASFSCSFAIHTSIFCLFKDFAHILGEKWLLLFFLEFWEFSYIMYRSPLSYAWLASVFSQSMTCLNFADCLKFERDQLLNFLL